MQRFVVVFAVLGVLGAAGCKSDEGTVKKKAHWLCEYSQLDGPSVEALQAKAPASNYIRAEDLAYVRERGPNNVLSSLATVSGGKLAPGVTALRKAWAERTMCDVLSVKVEGDTATATVKQSRPVLDEKGLFTALSELAQISSDQTRLLRAKALVMGAEEMKLQERTLKFVRAGGEWVASFELREQELAELKQRKLEADAARAALAKFVVTQASYGRDDARKPVIRLTVRNDTTETIARATLRGVLASAGRAEPWVKDTLTYEAAQPLAPGQIAEWTITPDPLSAWGVVTGAPEMRLTAEAIRLDGPGGKRLYALGFDEKDEARLNALQASVVD